VQFCTKSPVLILICAVLTAHLPGRAINNAPPGLLAGFFWRKKRGRGKKVGEKMKKRRRDRGRDKGEDKGKERVEEREKEEFCAVVIFR